MNTKSFLAVASVIFTVVALAHLVRLITWFEVVVGSYAIPAWCSVVGLIVAGFLAIAGWSLLRKA